MDQTPFDIKQIIEQLYELAKEKYPDLKIEIKISKKESKVPNIGPKEKPVKK